MNINEDFLTQNNITSEEYKEYYNSLEIPKIEKEINEHGLITLKLDSFKINFREDSENIDEEKASEIVEEHFRRSKTEIHFTDITKKIEEQLQQEEEKNILTEEEEYRNEVKTTLEYISCMLELNQTL